MDNFKKICTLFLALLMILYMAQPVLEAASPTARNISIFRVEGGDVTLARSFGGRQATPRSGQRLSEGNEVTTGWDSQVYFQLDAHSIMKMDESTQVVVASARERLVLSVQSGSVLVEVEQQAAGHSLETRIGNLAVGVRGTSFILRRMSFDMVVVTMLSGSGHVDFIDDTGGVVSVPVNAGYMIKIVDAFDPIAAIGVNVGMQAYLLIPIDYTLLEYFELVELLARQPELEDVLAPLIEARQEERYEARRQVLEREDEEEEVIVTYFGPVTTANPALTPSPTPTSTVAPTTQSAYDDWSNDWYQDDWYPPPYQPPVVTEYVYHNVYFHLGTGIQVNPPFPPSVVRVRHGATIGVPHPEPSSPTHHFLGWRTAPVGGGGVPFDFSTPIVTAIRLHAVWSQGAIVLWAFPNSSVAIMLRERDQVSIGGQVTLPFAAMNDEIHRNAQSSGGNSSYVYLTFTIEHGVFATPTVTWETWPPPASYRFRVYSPEFQLWNNSIAGVGGRINIGDQGTDILYDELRDGSIRRAEAVQTGSRIAGPMAGVELFYAQNPGAIVSNDPNGIYVQANVVALSEGNAAFGYSQALVRIDFVRFGTGQDLRDVQFQPNDVLQMPVNIVGRGINWFQAALSVVQTIAPQNQMIIDSWRFSISPPQALSVSVSQRGFGSLLHVADINIQETRHGVLGGGDFARSGPSGVMPQGSQFGEGFITVRLTAPPNYNWVFGLGQDAAHVGVAYTDFRSGGIAHQGLPPLAAINHPSPTEGVININAYNALSARRVNAREGNSPTRVMNSAGALLSGQIPNAANNPDGVNGTIIPGVNVIPASVLDQRPGAEIPLALVVDGSIHRATSITQIAARGGSGTQERHVIYIEVLILRNQLTPLPGSISIQNLFLMPNDNAAATGNVNIDIAIARGNLQRARYNAAGSPNQPVPGVAHRSSAMFGLGSNETGVGVFYETSPEGNRENFGFGLWMSGHNNTNVHVGTRMQEGLAARVASGAPPANMRTGYLGIARGDVWSSDPPRLEPPFPETGIDNTPGGNRDNDQLPHWTGVATSTLVLEEAFAGGGFYAGFGSPINFQFLLDGEIHPGIRILGMQARAGNRRDAGWIEGTFNDFVHITPGVSPPGPGPRNQNMMTFLGWLNLPDQSILSVTSVGRVTEYLTTIYIPSQSIFDLQGLTVLEVRFFLSLEADFTLLYDPAIYVTISGTGAALLPDAQRRIQIGTAVDIQL